MWRPCSGKRTLNVPLPRASARMTSTEAFVVRAMLGHLAEGEHGARRAPVEVPARPTT